MVGFEIYRDEGGEYRWRFRADNGEIVASGEGYRRKEDCEHAMRLMKGQAPQAEVADRTWTPSSTLDEARLRPRES